MIHEQDVNTIRRILGCEKTPEEVEKEYEIRSRMFHRAGGSGPLGVHQMIALVRSLKLAPPKGRTIDQVVDWGAQKQDGSVEVEVRYHDAWHRGKFIGWGDMNQLAVRLDGVIAIRSFPRGVVRLARPIKQVVDKQPEEPLPELPETVGELPLAHDWAQYKQGARVMVSLDDDLVDGTFSGVSGDTVFVQFDGEPHARPVPAADVSPV